MYRILPKNHFAQTVQHCCITFLGKYIATGHMLKPSKHTCANTESSFLTANTNWFTNNKQRTTWPTTFCSYSETGEKEKGVTEWQDGGILFFLSPPLPPKKQVYFRLKTANKISSWNSVLCVILHRLILSRRGKLVFYKYFPIWMTWNSFLCRTTFKEVWSSSIIIKTKQNKNQQVRVRSHIQGKEQI